MSANTIAAVVKHCALAGGQAHLITDGVFQAWPRNGPSALLYRVEILLYLFGNRA